MVEKISTNLNENVIKNNINNKSKLSCLLVQEIKIAKALASNDAKIRAKQLKKLRKWFELRSKSSFDFSDEDFMRIWKGLFYCMWMSDKPLVQEDLADELSNLLNCFHNERYSIQFFICFLKTICLEWFGIDNWRMDKFLMLVRRMLRGLFSVLNDCNWENVSIEILNNKMHEVLVSERCPEGLSMHIIEIFLPELAKVSNGTIEADSVALLLSPFVLFLSQQDDKRILNHLKLNLFHHLLWQTGRGREFNEKFEAWKSMGFPTTSIDDLEKVEVDNALEEEESTSSDQTTNINKSLDPRANNVDVFIPEISINVDPIIKKMESNLYKNHTTTKSRKLLRELIEVYKKFDCGEFPLGVKQVPKTIDSKLRPLVEKKVKEKINFENSIFSTTRKFKKLNKKKRRKILASLSFDECVDVDSVDKILEQSIKKNVKKSVKKINKCRNDWKVVSIDEKAKPVENATTSTLYLSSKKRKANSNCDAIKCNINYGKITPKRKLNVIAASESSESEENSDYEISPKKSKNTEKCSQNEWKQSLRNGEVEYFAPSRKNVIKSANKLLTMKKRTENSKKIVLNPFASQNIKGKNKLRGKKLILQNKSNKPTAAKIIKEKRVKIVLEKNISQKVGDYIHQVKNSPQLPFDANKRPVKSLLKPNTLPGPINPFYKHKLGLN